MVPAYVGPGAGFAFLGSFIIVSVAIVLAVVSVVSFPVRFTLRWLFRRGKRRGMNWARRVVVVGLDGLDPERTQALMDKGDLPNFAKLAAEGMFRPLATTCPPISPVAWSSFATGVRPGKHNVFDFLNRDLATYLPVLSSCRIDSSGVSLLRKSQPFWKVLGDHGVFSAILRVPITFPPEKFYGVALSGMCAPDLQGTQGAFVCYETAGGTAGNVSQGPEAGGGTRIEVTFAGKKASTYLPGPPLKSGQLRIPLKISLSKRDGIVFVRVSGRRVKLSRGVYSDWIRVVFRHGLRKARGICRMLLVSTDPHFRLYVTPINIDPESPVMPVSHPRYYATYLAKLQGPFATLGLAEDTWALSNGIITDDQFMKQAEDIHRERETMFFNALNRTRNGLCCCVFDLPDRIQHTFYRYCDGDHPAAPDQFDDRKAGAVDGIYRQMDALVGRVMERVSGRDLLIVMSDHGFASFRRGVNLNAWLRQKGYLAAKEGAEGSEYLRDVDWSRTKAYSFGLAGIYFNMIGRESGGIVPKDECAELAREISHGLAQLEDAKTGTHPVHKVYDAAITYAGPYRNNGPDLIVGYAKGYRASWNGAVGKICGQLFEENTRPWSGDHCIDAALVPGVIFCNRNLECPPGSPHITDVAPTILRAFGVNPPGYMDGRPLQPATAEG